MTPPMRRPETPIIIDVEASGFGGTSYPIEIGVALFTGGRLERSEMRGSIGADQGITPARISLD